jgi:hypothetical protein
MTVERGVEARFGRLEIERELSKCFVGRERERERKGTMGEWEKKQRRWKGGREEGGKENHSSFLGEATDGGKGHH